MRAILLAVMGALLCLPFAAAPAAALTMRLCTSPPGKTYVEVGEKLASLAGALTHGELTVEVVMTPGSVANLNLALTGQCDAFMIQADVLHFYEQRVDPDASAQLQVIGELYKELAVLLCRRDADIRDLDGLADQRIAVGGLGTGSLATLLAFRDIDPDSYGRIELLPMSGLEGARAVRDGKAICMFDVLAPRSPILSLIDGDPSLASVLRFGEIDNQNLEGARFNGRPLYEVVTVDDEIYPNLAQWGDPETVVVDALLVMTRAFSRAQPRAAASLALLLLMASSDIQKIAYGETKPFLE